MCKSKRCYPLALALFVLGALPGCATYMKCGFRGCAGDAQITSDVRARLDRYPELEPPNLIDVQTLDHVVYLYGLVDTDSERELAESVALKAPGVARVVDSIGTNNAGG